MDNEKKKEMNDREKWRTEIYLRILSSLTLLLALLTPASSAVVLATPTTDTFVSGVITSDTTWTLANSPYVVTDDVQVTIGVTLTIQAGVVVKFDRYKQLRVDGTLVARGTAENPITFTSNQDVPQNWDWKNITFSDTSVDAVLDGDRAYVGGCVLEYCIVEYGGYDDGVLYSGVVETVQAAPLIDHCTMRHNISRGISAVATSGNPIMVRHNTVSDNQNLASSHGSGIYVEYGTVVNNTLTANFSTNTRSGIFVAYGTVMSNTLTDGDGGIRAEYSTVTGNVLDNGGGIDGMDSTIENNIVTNHLCSQCSSAAGIGAAGGLVANNVVIGNTASGYMSFGGGIYAVGNSTVVISNTVSGNAATGSGAKGGGIYVQSGLVANNIVTDNTVNTTNGLGGGIYATGATVMGNVIGSNTAYEGGGVFSDLSMVVSNTIVANSVPADGQGSGVYYHSGEEFLYNTVVGNTSASTATVGGIFAHRHTYYHVIQIHHNNIYGNSPYDAMVIHYTEDVNATNNYWGTTSAATIEEHIYDQQDDLGRGRIFHDPYLQDPDPDAPVPPPQNLQADFNDSVKVTWDPIPSSTAVYGYKVHYGHTPGPPYDGTGADQGDSPIDVGNATSYTLSGLTGTVCIAATAYDAGGRESWYANETAVPILKWKVYLPLSSKSYQAVNR